MTRRSFYVTSVTRVGDRIVTYWVGRAPWPSPDDNPEDRAEMALAVGLGATYLLRDAATGRDAEVVAVTADAPHLRMKRDDVIGDIVIALPTRRA